MPAPYPHKPAPADHPILPAIKERWSPVAIGSEPIDAKTISTLFEAARWAPSCFNEQPWRYVYATKDDGKVREELELLLAEGNAWYKNAYLLIVSFAKKTFARNGKPNRHSLHDTGCASGYMVLQAAALGLVSHQMAGFDVKNANTVLGVPDDFEPGSMIAIGQPGDSKALPPDGQARDAAARTRIEQSAFAFRGKWKV